MKNELGKIKLETARIRTKTTYLEMGQIASNFKEKIKKHGFLENQQEL
jgi:hypothetical protein